MRNERPRNHRASATNSRRFTVIEEAAAAAAAAIVEKQELKPQVPRDDKIEVVLVRPGAPGSGGSGSPNNTPPAASSAPTGGGGYWPSPTAAELRKAEAQGEIEAALDDLRRAQDRMQAEEHKPGTRWGSGKPTDWLKN
jgi:hypothetical protein